MGTAVTWTKSRAGPRAEPKDSVVGQRVPREAVRVSRSLRLPADQGRLLRERPSRSRSICRRSRFDGRPYDDCKPAARRSSLSRSRFSTEASVSRYRTAASTAPPRRSDKPSTSTVKSSQPRLMFSVSPHFTSLAALARFPFSRTCPPSIADLACDRVLKKRAAHSHLSSRTEFKTA